jgi:hypothetical protein
MLLVLRKRTNWIGLGSLLLSLAPWIWVRVESPYDIVAIVSALVLASALAILAASLGSRWWFLALLSPVSGAALLLSLRT